MKTRLNQATFCLYLGIGCLVSACGNQDVQTVKQNCEPQSVVSSQTIEKKSYTIGNVLFNMVEVKGGRFDMGTQSQNKEAANFDSSSYEHERPVHKVNVSSFSIGETEVTQGLWKAVMGENKKWTSDAGLGDSLPAYNVSYNEIQQFLAALNDSLHKSNQLAADKNFELPTEAQWEFAARGGVNSQKFYYSGSDNIDEVAWYEGNSNEKVQPVGKKKANELGIYDMSGNVWEWCGNYTYIYPAEEETDPRPASGTSYALRGGGAKYDSTGPRCGCRGYNVSNYFDPNLGFRLCVR